MALLGGTSNLSSSGGAGRDELFRAAVLSGMDHVYPTIDFKADEEELSADEDEDILARYVQQLGGHQVREG